MSLQEFNQKAEQVKTFTSKPSDEELLSLYKYYKQATIGKCNTSKPWMIDITNYTKWTAWNSLGDLSKEEAMTNYINMVNTLTSKYV